MVPMKRVTVLLAAFALVLSAAPGRASGVPLDPLADGIALGGGILLAAGSEILLPLLPRVTVLPPAGISAVNPVDRAFMAPYSEGIDLASSLCEYSAAALPLVLAFLAPPDDLLSLGVVYAESLSFAITAKNLLKYLIPRYRPFVYLGGAAGVSATEDDQSFPSGHAALAFAAAGAGVSLFAAALPGSPWFWPFTAGVYGLAVLTASFRVASGMHFLSDVAAGAAVGSLFGYLVPFLHRVMPRDGGDRLSLVAGPGGALLRLRY
jgi:membrane-associated phospholipid phosphatase